MQTAVVFAFPGLSPLVDGWRARTCADDRPSMGIPPHVTLLYPFVAAEAAERSLGGLRELFAAVPYFAVSFRELRRWPEMAYLAPEPPEPFARLTEAIAERWPSHPPYEGIHDVVIPHLTVAYGADALLDAVDADITPKLPFDTVVTEAVLLEELAPESRWGERARFSLSLEAR